MNVLIGIDGLHQPVVPVILILRGEGFRGSIGLGAVHDLGQLVAVGVIRELADIAQRIGLLRDAAIDRHRRTVVNPAAASFNRERHSLGVVGICSDLTHRILAGEQVSIGVIGIASGRALRIGDAQHLVAAVVGVSGHVAQRIGFRQPIAGLHRRCN